VSPKVGNFSEQVWGISTERQQPGSSAAYSAHPERFAGKPPAPPELPGTSWINPPQEKEAAP
jgi:hypothetical protein